MAILTNGTGTVARELEEVVFFTDDSASRLGRGGQDRYDGSVYEGVARFRKHLDEILQLC